MLTGVECTNLRLASVKRLIQSLSDGDFPYSESRDALARIENLFNRLESAVANAVRLKNPATINTACSQVLNQIFIYMPLLGFILRSTNVRTAFEIHGPLNRSTKALLGPDVKLLVSSEWDYSPYTYQPIPNLTDFVFLGLPASESANPLILPLAGHELGHSLWEHRNILARVKTELVTAIHEEIKLKRWVDFTKLVAESSSKDPNDFGNDFFDLRAIAPATEWAYLQAEETFCDFLGLRLFGQAYLQALGFLLLPGLTSRVQYYPSLPTRFENLKSASSVYGVEVPSEFSKEVSGPKLLKSWNDLMRFQVSLADEALAKNIKLLTDIAREYADASTAPQPKDKNIKRIAKQCFRRGLPAPEASTLVDILNAGWEVTLSLRKEIADPKEIARQEENLSEIMLKSIEIIEVDTRMKAGASVGS